MRKAKGGKLPIGFFNAKVNDVSYLGIHIRNLTATLNSDGAVATGDIYQSGRIRDLYFSYSFTDTDQMQKMKITKPGIKFHKETEEYKAQREERKQQKKLEKEEKKAQKEKEKQQKKLEKEQKKLEKQQKKLEQEQQKGETQEGEKKGFFKKLFGKKKKTETT
jgi:septin family protein